MKNSLLINCKTYQIEKMKTGECHNTRGKKFSQLTLFSLPHERINALNFQNG